MGGRRHGYVVLGDVDAEFETVLIDVGEVAARLFGILVCDVEVHMVVAVELHFGVDGAGHDVARGERQPRIVLVHEFLAAQVAQHSAVAAHGLRDQERRSVAGMEQGGGVELDEFHVLDGTLCAVDHGDTVAGGHQGVGGCLVDGSGAAGRHDGDTRQELVDAAALLVEHVGAVAGDVGGASGDDAAQMVLGYDLDSEVVLEYVDVGIAAHGLDESSLNLEAGVVGVVKNAEFRMAALTVQIEAAVVAAVEVDTVLDQEAYAIGGTLDHFLDCCGVAEPVAGHHGVVDVFVEVVDFEVGHRSDAALGQGRVGLVEGCLAHQGHAAFGSGLQGETHAGYTRADHEKIIFVGHCFLYFFAPQKY